MLTLPPSPAALQLTAAGGYGALQWKESIGFLPFPTFSALSNTRTPQPKASSGASRKERGQRRTTFHCIAKETSGAGAPAGLLRQPGGRFPPLPALLLLLLPASPTPSTSRAARRWGRSFWPLPERARRFFPGSVLPGRERRKLSSGASPPLGFPALRSSELSRHFVPSPGEGRPGYRRPTSRHKPDDWSGTSSTLIPAPAGGWARRGARTPAP